MKAGWRPRRQPRWLLGLALLALGIAVAAVVAWDSSPASIARELESRRPVDVNSATFEEIVALPYISDKVARAIIESRPYAQPEDLLRVRGIGPKILQRIRPYVRTVPPPVDRPDQRH